jgi:hypothetical protein
VALAECLFGLGHVGHRGEPCEAEVECKYEVMEETHMRKTMRCCHDAVLS